MFEIAGATAGHDWNADRFTDAARNDQIETGFCPIGIDAVQNDFPCPQRHRLPGPFDDFEAGSLASAVRENLPSVRCNFLCVDGDDDALAAEFFSPKPDEFWTGERGRIDAGLVRSGFEHGLYIRNGTNAPANGQRHETMIRGALDDRDHALPAFGAGGDVKENHFVRALIVVTDGQFDRIAHIAKFPGLRFAELHTTSDLAIVDIKTGNNAFRQHIKGRRVATTTKKESP